MSVIVNIYYRGRNGAARAFAEEMTASGTVDRIRAEEGNERYEYFLPMSDPEGDRRSSRIPDDGGNRAFA